MVLCIFDNDRDESGAFLVCLVDVDGVMKLLDDGNDGNWGRSNARDVLL